ncbi:MAG TPA: ferrous iron transport protein A, partial [Actinotalea sp.]
VQLLHHPQQSPYGNPIPGLAELGEVAEAHGFLDGVVPLLTFAGAADDRPSEPGGDGPAQAVVGRLGEPLQTDIELLERLAAAGVLPGATVTVERGAGVVTVGVPGAAVVLDLPDDVARHVFVVVAPA